MSRGIKFRAWQVAQKRMDYNPCFSASSLEGTTWININDAFKDEEQIFLFYTGLKDKTGKEIYEGEGLQNPKGQIGNLRALHNP